MWLNKKNKKKLPRFARQNLYFFGIKALFLVLIIVLVFTFIFLQRPVRSFFYSVSQPIQRWFWSKGAENSGFWSAFLRAKELRIENERLEKENQFFLSRVIEMNQLKNENEKLRQALELGLPQEFQLLEAKILSKNITEDSFVINKGAEDGIQRKMIVINQQKALVGQVVETYKKISKVRLLTNSKFDFSARVADTKIQALAKGMGSQRIKLTLVPKKEELLSGALVITGGQEADIPFGLLVGKIGKIEKNDLSPFQEAEVQPLFNIQEDNILFVIIN